MRSPQRGRPRPFIGVGGIQGLMAPDPAGNLIAIPYDQIVTLIGAGNITGPASSTDNAIARWNGTSGKSLQDSTPIVQDDGRISTVTDPTSAQDAATKAYVDASIAAIPTPTGGHAHGLHRATGDGATTTFDLPDIAATLQMVSVAGLIADPLTHALSADGSQVVFDVAPNAADVIVISYILASA